MNHKLTFVITILAAFSFILWWGGFTFYASFVIPIGQKVLGDHVMMGFITREVAPKINYAALVACLLCFINEWFRSSGKIKMMRRFAVICLSIMLVLTMSLFLLYPNLSALLDTTTHSELNHEHFYSLHRVYLIISTLLWINGVVFILFSIKGYKDSE